MDLRVHLKALPDELASAMEETYAATIEHYLKREWDDAQVDAGRYCEALLRYLQWKQTKRYTPIDGKSKPNRKAVVNKVQQDPDLDPSLRSQLPESIELMMDFRNNRNSAHLGDIDANQLDAITVVHLAQWTIGEIIRLETQQSPAEVQSVIDGLAQPFVPLIQRVGDTPIVLKPDMGASDKALLLLYEANEPADIGTLRRWAEYSNSTRWRKNVIADLVKAKKVFLEGEAVHLLNPGIAEAQRLLLEHGGQR